MPDLPISAMGPAMDIWKELPICYMKEMAMFAAQSRAKPPEMYPQEMFTFGMGKDKGVFCFGKICTDCAKGGLAFVPASHGHSASGVIVHFDQAKPVGHSQWIQSKLATTPIAVVAKAPFTPDSMPSAVLRRK